MSDSVLDAIAGALQLDDAERDHLFDLARTANTSPARRLRRSTRVATVRPGLQLMLDAITVAPALIRNGRLDIIAANTLGRASHAASRGAAIRTMPFSQCPLRVSGAPRDRIAAHSVSRPTAVRRLGFD